jgi:hypothetical protein
MTFGPGRPAKPEPQILGIRYLEEGEADGPRGHSAPIKALRDSHHMIARLLALGLPVGEVAYRTGYSLTRVSTLKRAPAVQELIAHYRAQVDEAYGNSTQEYFTYANQNRNASARMINDKLMSGEPEDFSVQQLVAIHADFADRTGFPKRSLAVNVNLDFAAALDRAIARSREVACEAVTPPLPLLPTSQQASPPRAAGPGEPELAPWSPAPPPEGQG